LRSESLTLVTTSRMTLTTVSKVYDLSFENGDSFDTAANPGDKDGLKFNARGRRALQRRDSFTIDTSNNKVAWREHTRNRLHAQLDGKKKQVRTKAIPCKRSRNLTISRQLGSDLDHSPWNLANELRMRR
jgi:hypothetical protein